VRLEMPQTMLSLQHSCRIVNELQTNQASAAVAMRSTGSGLLDSNLTSYNRGAMSKIEFLLCDHAKSQTKGIGK
jgi:hypothetical protein